MTDETKQKLYYFEYIYETEEGKKSNYIAAYNYQQSGNIFANEILAKNDAEELDVEVFVISDERALEMGLNDYTKPGIVS